MIRFAKFTEQEQAEMLSYHREHLCAFCEMNEETIKAIREWVDIMKDEPPEYIQLSEVYHRLRRMLGDE